MSERPLGHCNDEEAWADFAPRLETTPRRALALGEMSDFELANAVFLADRNSPDLLMHQTAAKERIRWLSVQLAKAQRGG